MIPRFDSGFAADRSDAAVALTDEKLAVAATLRRHVGANK